MTIDKEFKDEEDEATMDDLSNWLNDLLYLISENDQWSFLVLVKHPQRFLPNPAELGLARVVGEIQLRKGLRKRQPIALPKSLICPLVTTDSAIFLSTRDDEDDE
jgi:hypothetical protein